MDLTGPLTDLTRKGASDPDQWTEQHWMVKNMKQRGGAGAGDGLAGLLHPPERPGTVRWRTSACPCGGRSTLCVTTS